MMLTNEVHTGNLNTLFPSPTDGMILLQTIQKTIPGSVQYEVHRFQRPLGWNLQDTLLLHYTPSNKDHANSDSCIDLKFCVSGNFYCKEKSMECDQCKWHESASCVEKLASVDWLNFSYSHAYLQQFAKSQKKTGLPAEQIFNGSYSDPLVLQATLNVKTRNAIDAFLNHQYTDTRENIFINAQAQILLLFASELVEVFDEKKITNRSDFLKYEEEREKIIAAREILLEHIGTPITIKALSRKVAINECYLKKGFKEIFGTTIFDFYQGQRMEHAKYLLYEKGMTVTEVSASLGYSSISHFSTAFKKHTGLKPCELLMRQ